MPNRVVARDSTGLYVKYENAFFRPVTLTAFLQSQPVEVSHWRSKPMILRVWSPANGYRSGEEWVSVTPVARKLKVKTGAYKGQRRVAKYVGGANLSVLISETGVIKVGSQTRKGDIYFALNAGMTLTVEQWEALVTEINDAVSDTLVNKVATKLKEELDLEEEMDSIRSKYVT